MVFYSMPAEFSAETRVANSVYKYLKDVNAEVIQLVAPGGQARVSITFSAKDKRRTVFPDVLAVLDGAIFVGEMKPRFSKSDKTKLNELRSSSDGLESIRSVVSRYLNRSFENYPLVFCLMHGDVTSVADSEIAQFCFAKDGTVVRK